MATTRLVVVLLTLATVLLLVLQNLTPALPLVFLGSRSVALPVGVWLFGAIGLGALTTLGLTVLLKLSRGGGSGRRRYQYEPQPFYEPAEPTSPSSAPRSSPASDPDRQTRYGTTPADRAAAATTDSSWQSWADLQAPARWDSWESDRRAPDPMPYPDPGSYGDPNGDPAAAAYDESPTARRSAFSWFGRRDSGASDQRVQDSLQAITDDWGDLERRSYRAPGVSPVDESLEEITEGWDDIDAAPATKQVYEDGSIYSYSYRDRTSDGSTDRIYAPPDSDSDASYPESSYDNAARPGQERPDGYPNDRDYPNDLNEDDLDEESPMEEGVVDADYRVIIPPYNPPSDDASSPPPLEDDDDWEEADDVLLP